MRIGELAKRAGVSVQAVRFYERRGLLAHAFRTTSGYREYEPRTVEELLSIKRAQELGFTLQEIKQMQAMHTDSMSRDRARAFAAEKLQVFDEKIAWLKKMKKQLADSLRRAEAVRGCPAATRPTVVVGAHPRGKRNP